MTTITFANKTTARKLPKPTAENIPDGGTAADVEFPMYMADRREPRPHPGQVFTGVHAVAKAVMHSLLTVANSA